MELDLDGLQMTLRQSKPFEIIIQCVKNLSDCLFNRLSISQIKPFIKHSVFIKQFTMQPIETDQEPEHSMEDSNNRSHKNSHSNNCLPINKLVIVEAVVAVILLLALLLTMRFYFEELQGLRDVHKQVVQDYLKDQLLIGTVMADLDQGNVDYFCLKRQVEAFIGVQKDRNLSISQKIVFEENVNIFAKVLYRNLSIVKMRQQFNKFRKIFFNRYTDYYPELKTAMYTLQMNSTNKTEEKIVLDSDYIRVDKKYNLSLYTKELPMCVIMTGRNNNANFRIEYALNSVFLQNYSNYHAIVVDDFSSDGSQDIYLRYFDFYGLKNDKATLILTDRRITALQNILNAVFNHCKKDQIGVSIDGDDELIGRNVLSVFNSYYNRNQYGFVYSKFVMVDNHKSIFQQVQFRKQFSRETKDNQGYRNTPDIYFSKIETWRIAFTYEIDLNDLKYSTGNYFNITYDKVLFYPIIELSCGQVEYVQEYNYLYNVQTGNNDYLNHQYQQSVEEVVEKMKTYPCSKMYGSYKSRAEKYNKEK